VPVAVPGQESDAPAAAPAGTELNLIQRAVAAITRIPTDGALQQQVAALTADRDALRAQVGTLTAERDSARAALARHEADLTALRDALDAPAGAQQMQTPAGQAAAAAVSQQVGAHLRALSHPAANLPAKPAAGTDPAGSSRPDDLREAFKAETDPVKKSALFRQIKEADEAAKARAN
jgi:hypothetical protein